MHLLSFFVQLHTWLSCLPVSVTFDQEINHEGIFDRNILSSQRKEDVYQPPTKVFTECVLWRKHREFHSILQHSFLSHILWPQGHHEGGWVDWRKETNCLWRTFLERSKLYILPDIQIAFWARRRRRRNEKRRTHMKREPGRLYAFFHSLNSLPGPAHFSLSLSLYSYWRLLESGTSPSTSFFLLRKEWWTHWA